jgi:tRNA dimethylallyltransferase
MLLLLGPTAVGKTDLSLQVAHLLNAEIINADAFQIYRGLDLLTAKPPPAQRAAIPHHLIGEIPLTHPFDVAEYHTLALARIRNIHSRHKRPLIVGGTPLYIRALTRGLSQLPPADPALRTQLNHLPLEALQQKYQSLDPHGFALIDTKNPRRLIRAIEVTLLTGRPFSTQRPDWSSDSDSTEPSAQKPIPAIVLDRPRPDLYTRIDQRVSHMFAHGVVDEIRAIHKISPTAAQAIGYTEIKNLLRGDLTESACIAAIQQRTRQYAKRQLTWLRSCSTFQTLDLTRTSPHQAADLIARQLLAAEAPAGPQPPRLTSQDV